VVETAIRYPTDNSLLGDGVRMLARSDHLSRSVKRLLEIGP
jgi:hypothetical protein